MTDGEMKGKYWFLKIAILLFVALANACTFVFFLVFAIVMFDRVRVFVSMASLASVALVGFGATIGQYASFLFIRKLKEIK